MIISTQTDVLGRRFGAEKAITILASAGYDAYDFSMFNIKPESNPVFGEDWENYATTLRKHADTLGITCNQAHAPFPSTQCRDDYNTMIFEKIVRAMDFASRLGAKAIIVHPCQHLNYWEHADYLFDYNMNFYRSLAPYAKKFGIKVALENMWQMKDGHIVDSTCGEPKEFMKYLDTLADDCFTGCLDLGHCGLSGHECASMIREMGANYIGCLHIHDNDNLHDSHTLPYMLSMDWKAILSALHDIGYKGDFTYEADNFLAKFPNETLPQATNFMASLARQMARQIRE